ncbi:MAG: site-2 protease family protein [Promethearchaeota archaeon]
MKIENDLKISEKIRQIVGNHYQIVIFKEENYSFEPFCIIKIDKTIKDDTFNNLQENLKKIGFQAKFKELNNKEIYENDLELFPGIKYYRIFFIAKQFNRDKKTSKKTLIIQSTLFSITFFTIVLSALLYIQYIEPYYGGFGTPSMSTLFSILSYCIGMFLIILIHEFGHYFLGRHYGLKISLPYLIPGPPPIGMLGAFVSIKDDPQTRNQKFDIALGGILLGILISVVLILIGLLFSMRVDTLTYIQLRADYFNITLQEGAKTIQENFNHFNLLFLFFRNIIFEQPTFSEIQGILLPEKILLLHPLAFSGWIGLLISGLNLIPLSFLDGGHIFHAIFPKSYSKLIGTLIGAIILLILNFEFLWLVWFSLIGSINSLNRKNISSIIPNPIKPLTKSRIYLGLLTIILFILLYPLSFENLIYGFTT